MRKAAPICGWTVLAGAAALSMTVSAIVFAQASAVAERSAHGTAPGERVAPYARYTPFRCAQISDRVSLLATRDSMRTWRDRWPDTVIVPRRPNTINAASVSAARACVANYTVAGTPPDQLLGLGKAYIAANDALQADAAFKRTLETGAGKAASVEQRAWLLSLIVGTYIAAGPDWLPQALDFAAQLDALGAPAAARRVAVHNELFKVMSSLDTLPLMDAEIQAALTASRELTGEARQQWALDVVNIAKNQAALEVRRGNGPAAVAILKKALADLTLSPNDWRRASIEGDLNLVIRGYEVIGTRAPPVQSMFVYAPGKAVSTKPIGRPTQGTVSLFFFSGINMGDTQWHAAFDFQKICTTYAARGVECTIVSATQGGDLTFGKIFRTPEEEGEAMRQLFHEYLKLPAPIVSWTTKHTKDPVDGHLISDWSPNPFAYRALVNVVIDKAGRTRIFDIGGVTLQHVIEEELAK